MAAGHVLHKLHTFIIPLFFPFYLGHGEERKYGSREACTGEGEGKTVGMCTCVVMGCYVFRYIL